jgi:hypothetical protein
MASKKVSIGLVFVVLFALSAVVGNNSIGIHPECKDGIDNDLDSPPGQSNIDYTDDDCFAYPYADGNGESFTPEQDRRNSDRYLDGNAYYYWQGYAIDNGINWDFAICPSLGAPPTGWSAIYQIDAHTLEIDYITNNCPP